MSKLNDEIVRATGGPTLNGGLALWYSKTASESLQDAEARWLFSQAAVTALEKNQDMWFKFLDVTYDGTLNDMKLAYWSAQP